MTLARQIRAENYRAKRARRFRCAMPGCSVRDRILVVEAKTSGELTTRCEHHLDKRTHAVRPHQWDEAERLQAEMAKKKAAG